MAGGKRVHGGKGRKARKGRAATEGMKRERGKLDARARAVYRADADDVPFITAMHLNTKRLRLVAGERASMEFVGCS